MLTVIFLCVFAYFCGSIPFGKIIAARHGIDIQKRGSGNIGFANVRRIVGWRAGVLSLGGDIVKGAVPTIVALHYCGHPVAFFVGFSAVLGHVFCCWLRFTGGKGVATGLGVVTVLSPVAAIIGSTLYITLSIVRVRSSTASAAGAVATAIVATTIAPLTWWYYLAFIVLLAWTLRRNFAGTVPDYDI